jgi:hypothetical protein
MLASELVAELLKSILADGDGEVIIASYAAASPSELDVEIDEDAWGKVTSRRYILS